MTYLSNQLSELPSHSDSAKGLSRNRLLNALDADTCTAIENNELVAVILFDIKDFHDINYRYGYDTGDELLLSIHRLVSQSIKKASISGRLSNNTFAVVIPDLKSEAFVELAAEKIKKTIRSINYASSHPPILDCYFGVSFFPNCEMASEKLLIQAEQSLKLAKAAHRTTIDIPKRDKSDNFSISSLERGLVKAIANSELQFYYQPKVRLDNNLANSAEALIRWNSSEFGLVSPDHFIAVAERSKLIRELTEWILKTTLREKIQLDEQLDDFSLSVNLSAKDLYGDELVHTIDNALNIWNVDPENLTMEITEGVILQDKDQAFRQLARLRDRGIKISIDDFGTGYSSLSYFKNIPADELKIDKSFVSAMQENSNDAAIIELIVSLAKKFNLSVVAEGVEDENSLKQLRDMGCDYAQGYFFSPPVPRDEFIDWATAHNTVSKN